MTPDLRPRLRQVAVITRTVAPVEADLTAILDAGLASRFEGVDGYGLGTAFFAVGNEIFEVVHAAVPGTTADRFIDRRGGDGGFIVMLECTDLPAYRTRAEVDALRVVVEGDDADTRFVQLHPKDTGGTFLELREMLSEGAGEPDGPWSYGGPSWRDARDTRRVGGIVAAELQAEDPDALSSVWARLLGLPREQPRPGVWQVGLRGGELRFVAARDDRGDGLAGIDVAVSRSTRRGRIRP